MDKILKVLYKRDWGSGNFNMTQSVYHKKSPLLGVSFMVLKWTSHINLGKPFSHL